MKATAETIREAAAGAHWRGRCPSRGLCRPHLLGECDCASNAIAALSTLPITLDQLAKYANGELVLAHKGDLIIPAALRGDPDRVSTIHTTWIAASAEKDKTT